MVQLTDGLFPLPAKHTLERREVDKFVKCGAGEETVWPAYSTKAAFYLSFLFFYLFI